MRLIDDDELNEIIDGNENLLDWQKEEMKLCVDACDTAYNLEAVLNELDKLRTKPMELVYDVPLIDYIYEIVKSGGKK